MDLPGDICGTTVRNKDGELKTFWESSGISYGGLHEVVMRPTLSLRQTDALSSCVSGQRGTIAKSMYEEHLCRSPEKVLSEEPSSFRLSLTSLCDLPLLFVYFQVNNGVLYFLDYEDNLHRGPLCSRFNVVRSSFL